MSAPPLLFDRAQLRARLTRAAPGYGNADFLKRRAAEDAVVRLEAILREFPRAVDLGARNGAFREALAASDAASRVGLLVEADLAPAMLAGRGGPRVVADEERLPFAFGSLDLVVSTLALHWTNDVVGALIQIRRALKPDGLFIGSMFGGATLLLQDEVYIKWKPTVLNWLFGLVFIASHFIGKRPVIQRLMDRAVSLPRNVWYRLNLLWSVFFIAIGFINLYVVYNFDTDTWVNFKLFGIFGLTLVFIVVQSFYIGRYVKQDADGGESS